MRLCMLPSQAIVDFIGKETAAAAAAAAAGGDGDNAAAEASGSGGGASSKAADAGGAAQAGPSNLLKTLRPPATVRPLFLAAPGA